MICCRINIESLQSHESRVSRSETSLLKVNIVFLIGLLHLLQMIGTSDLLKYLGTDDCTDISLNMLGKSIKK